MQNVFVTGITGKSGLYFLDEIAKHDDNDYSFSFLVRSEEKAEQVKAKCPKAKTVVGDCEDLERLKEIFTDDRYDTVVHIAGVHRSLPLVEAAVWGGVQNLILVHTTGIYSKYKAAGESYRQTEVEIEKLIEGKDISKTILRPTMIYGNLRDGNVSIFMKMVYKLRIFPVVNHAAYELQPVWCGDLGKAYYQVLTHTNTRGKDYNLSGGRPILLIDMFKVMAEKLGVKNRYVNVPFGLAYSGAWMLCLCTFGKKDYREKVQRLVEPRIFSHEEATRDFGYDPLPFEEGVNGEIEEFLSRERQTR